MAQGKKHAPTDASRGVVTALVGFGIPQDDIALYLGISPPTLRSAYRAELDSGRIRANAAVIANFFKIAAGKKGKPAEQIRAATWWLERLSGLTIEPPGEGAEAPEDMDEQTYHTMTDGELERIARAGRPADKARAERAQRRRRPRGTTGPVH